MEINKNVLVAIICGTIVLMIGAYTQINIFLYVSSMIFLMGILVSQTNENATAHALISLLKTLEKQDLIPDYLIDKYKKIIGEERYDKSEDEENNEE